MRCDRLIARANDIELICVHSTLTGFLGTSATACEFARLRKQILGHRFEI